MSTSARTALIFPAEAASAGYNLSIGYLRSFVTILVLAHHAVLAYHPFAPPVPGSLSAGPQWWRAFPVVDTERWTGFALFAGFNDVFFMALMFFLSGMFVWRSLERKGALRFLRDRAVRLGIPFVVAAAVVPLAAYYPTYLLTQGEHNLTHFWSEWRSLGNWPTGPAWFISLLLLFDVLAAGLFVVLPRWGTGLGQLLSSAPQRPAVFFGSLVAASAAAYVPMAMAFGALEWSVIGPFTFQTSRLFHYLVYFAAGVGIGALGPENGLLVWGSRLARRWALWLVAALAAFAFASVVAVLSMSQPPPPPALLAIGAVGFAISCAASSFALMAMFARFTCGRVRLFEILRDNAYGMYLIHYLFASWLQYALLPASMPGLVKGTLVTAGTVVLSWAATAALRRIRVVSRVI